MELAYTSEQEAMRTDPLNAFGVYTAQVIFTLVMVMLCILITSVVGS